MTLLLKIKTKIPILMNLQTFINRLYTNLFFFFYHLVEFPTNTESITPTHVTWTYLVVKKTHTKNIQQSSQQKLGGGEKSSKSSILQIGGWYW